MQLTWFAPPNLTDITMPFGEGMANHAVCQVNTTDAELRQFLTTVSGKKECAAVRQLMENSTRVF
jgi:hypothetical protein